MSDKEKQDLNDLKTESPHRGSPDAESPGWLSRNIRAVLALIVVLLTFAIFTLVLLGDINPTIQDSNLAMMILGGLLTLVAQVVSYFFGSSRDAGRKSSFSLPEKELINKPVRPCD